MLAFCQEVDVERGVQRLGHSRKMVFLEVPFAFNIGFEQPETDEEFGHL